ncbi:MAG: hypothetical protein ACREIU_09175 [Planctomycetota bacterium]
MRLAPLAWSLLASASGNHAARRFGRDGRVTTHVGRFLREIPAGGGAESDSSLGLRAPSGIAALVHSEG